MKKMHLVILYSIFIASFAMLAYAVNLDEHIDTDWMAIDHKVGDTWTEPTTGMQFMWIPAGCFMMGSPEIEEGREDDEGPVHKVCLDGFWMGKYEVTQDEWKKIMGSNPSSFKQDNLPVDRVEWVKLQEFLAKLNGKGTGTFRLPTEAEWEYACRAGTTTPYFFGESITTNQANFNRKYEQVTGLNRKVTTPGGSFPANAWGLCDMHGNLWEWCYDEFDMQGYSKIPEKNPVVENAPGHIQVLRGGSWSDSEAELRSACRLGFAFISTDFFGFRLVRIP